MKCAICGKEITGWGNNPWPVRTDENAQCCDECNATYVIAARMVLMGENRDRVNDVTDMLNGKSYEELQNIFSI